MDEQEILRSEKPNGLFGIIITEAIVVAIILLSCLTVKYFFKNNFSDLEKWYDVHICAETDVNEVVESGNNRTAGGGVDEV